MTLIKDNKVYFTIDLDGEEKTFVFVLEGKTIFFVPPANTNVHLSGGGEQMHVAAISLEEDVGKIYRSLQQFEATMIQEMLLQEEQEEVDLETLRILFKEEVDVNVAFENLSLIEDQFKMVFQFATGFAQQLAATRHELAVEQAGSLDAAIEGCKRFLREEHGFELPEGQ